MILFLSIAALSEEFSTFSEAGFSVTILAESVAEFSLDLATSELVLSVFPDLLSVTATELSFVAMALLELALDLKNTLKPL